MWIGALAVPRTPMCTDFPTFGKAERPPLLSSSLAELEIPVILHNLLANKDSERQRVEIVLKEMA